MKKILRWIGIGIGAVIAFFIAILIGKEEGQGEGKIDQKTADDIQKVKDAAQRGDTDTIDGVWKDK